MTVKASMPTLYKQLKKLPLAAVPAVSSVSIAGCQQPLAGSLQDMPGTMDLLMPEAKAAPDE